MGKSFRFDPDDDFEEVEVRKNHQKSRRNKRKEKQTLQDSLFVVDDEVETTSKELSVSF